MTLAQPQIIGPLTELSTSIRVRGQVPGSTVDVLSASRAIARGTVGSGDERLPLLPGVSLKQGETLFATQEFAGEMSAIPAATLWEPVGPGPASLGGVSIPFEPVACARYLLIDSAVPGATVRVMAGGTDLAQGIAPEGTAVLALSRPLLNGEGLQARQECVTAPPGPSVSRRVGISGPLGQPLLPPTIDPVPRGCDGSLRLTGVLPGAEVFIDRASGLSESAPGVAASERIALEPLKEGDEITVRQEIDVHCERPPRRSAPVTVGPLQPVERPVIVGPLCQGGTAVRVTGLRPGALVRLVANQTTYLAGVPKDATTLDVQIPPLTRDPVAATQELCGVQSPLSDKAYVSPHSAKDKVAAPEVVAPLYGCVSLVALTRVHPGSWLQVFTETPSGVAAISPRMLVAGVNVVVKVSPLLSQGARVFARQWACSDEYVDSAHVEVTGAVIGETIAYSVPPRAGDTTVVVRGAVEGARVEVSVDGDGPGPLIAATTTDPLHPVAEIPLTRPLVAGEHVVIRQELCGRSSDGVVAWVAAGPAPGPRPLWILGHNTNTRLEVEAALKDGANALEPDVQVYDDDRSRLCISHDPGDTDAPAIVSFLKELRALADQHPALGLIVFDCKEEATSADHGYELLMAIRQHLTRDTDISVVLSVGKLAHTDFFSRIHDLLGPREGLMIDAEDDPTQVLAYFQSHGVTQQGYGNGITFVNVALGPGYRRSVEAACGIRAQTGQPRFVYFWTVNNHDALRELLRVGVDGIITDDPSDLVAISKEAAFTGEVRFGSRADNPLRPHLFGYSLRVKTADRFQAGTDAAITFTLQGSAGSISRTVDASRTGRMEADGVDWVTIPAPDLGPLTSLTLSHDGSGLGPDWFVDDVVVSSARYGANGTASFGVDIAANTPVTRPIV